MYDLHFNEHDASEFGVYVERRPDIPAPKLKTEKITVPGRDGDFYVSDETWGDIKIKASLAFYVPSADIWMQKWRDIKTWLSVIRENRLSFTDDPEYFYRVKTVELADAGREIRKQGKSTVTFLCEPYQYWKPGAEWQALPENGVLVNPFLQAAHPRYRIRGEGMCTLTVNGYELTANVGQNMVIDTDRQLTYREDGEMQNTAVTGDYTQLYLQEDEQTITVSDGFELEIEPNWRTL